jgi:hypothetical protein
MQGMSNGKYRYYRCGGRCVGVCQAPHIRADKAEKEFAAWLADIHLPPDWRKELARIEIRAVVADERERTRGIEEQIARLRNLYRWGDIKEDEYRAETARLKGEAAVMVKPDMVSLEKLAEILANVGKVWLSIPIERRRELPGKLLTSIKVESGQITELVARPELKPLLELGVVAATGAYTRRPNYTVSFSA